MADVNLVIQGKGGVGKTFVSTLLAQYLAREARQVTCVDTDPVNATFAAFEQLKVIELDLLQDQVIEPRLFDNLIGLIEKTKGPMVVDSGASSFVVFVQYLLDNEIPNYLSELGHKFTVHTVVTGGQAFGDCAANLLEMVQRFPETTNFVVWLNPFFGPIVVDGKEFQDMKVYAQCKDRIRSLIELPTIRGEFIVDLREMLSKHLTFAEALIDNNQQGIVRQRLKIARDRFFGAIDGAALE